jgi:hypothetical protein
LEPDLGNASEGNDSQIRTTNRTKPFPAGDGFFICRALPIAIFKPPMEIFKINLKLSEVGNEEFK